MPNTKQTPRNTSKTSGKKRKSRRSKNKVGSSASVPAQLATEVLGNKSTESIVVSGHDLLLDNVETHDIADGAIIATIALTANLPERLKTLSTAFQRIKWKSVVIRIVPRAATNTSGGYIAALVRDVTDVFKTGDKARLASINPSVSNVIWRPGSLSMRNAPDLYYTDFKANEPRWSAPGQVIIMIDGPVNQSAPISIWMDWTAELSEASMETESETTSVRQLGDNLWTHASSTNAYGGDGTAQFVPSVVGLNTNDYWRFDAPRAVTFGSYAINVAGVVATDGATLKFWRLTPGDVPIQITDTAADSSFVASSETLMTLYIPGNLPGGSLSGPLQRSPQYKWQLSSKFGMILTQHLQALTLASRR